MKNYLDFWIQLNKFLVYVVVVRKVRKNYIQKKQNVFCFKRFAAKLGFGMESVIMRHSKEIGLKFKLEDSIKLT